MSHDASLQAAVAFDAADPLTALRERFHIPTHRGVPVRYFCGNSLGLQPRAVKAALDVELDAWASLGVEGHFEGVNPWFSYNEPLAAPLASIVGAWPDEVVVMNSLTTNLHLLMTSFYRPSGRRRCLLVESSAFPSDHYAADSQAKLRGLDPRDAVIEVTPSGPDEQIETEDIEEILSRRGEEIALVMLGGVQYYTGQVLDMARITAAAHRAGALVGFDLAHAVGNVELALHDWGVDFAVWCSYKYLNAGPGAVGGAFVHARHGERPELDRLSGWWGNDPATRFEMPRRFLPQRGAAGWQLSNAPVMSMAPLKASLELFEEVGMSALCERSGRQNRYLRALLSRIDGVELITPDRPGEKGCQVSVRVPGSSSSLQAQLKDAGVICDFRRPDVLRIAPTPLYNTFEDIWHLVEEIRARV